MTKKLIFCLSLLSLFSFSSAEKDLEFEYPKNKAAVLYMTTDNFKKFTKEWRGEDYYYLCEDGKDGMICSVLFYKLNKDEQKLMVDSFDPEGHTTSPILPFTHFMNSNLKDWERNNQFWGEAEDDFMFRQNDIPEVRGAKINQKNMYAYCMFDKNIFVNVHLSKVNYTAKDSTEMRQILASLKKKK